VRDSRADHEFFQALVALEASDDSPMAKVEMLAHMALGLQQKPKSPEQLEQAVSLYDRAIELCPEHEQLVAARLHAGRATALRAIPGGIEHLQLARAELERAIPLLRDLGANPEEIADGEMSLGVVLHSLAGVGAARLTDAIAAYQRATRVFDRQRYPREFAILQNNLATAYLATVSSSLPLGDERAKLREALAVQAFTDALAVVTLTDDPVEYAMLQNNLGNALQYAASGHPLQNNLRALEAYDAALEVRNARDTPVQYANTLANKANCLRNLPDDPERPAAGNRGRLREAADLYAEAAPIFTGHAEFEKAAMVEQARAEVLRELRAAETPHDFGVSRIGGDG
jgi:tetratricopeptide (TPR) repeat protein